MQEIQHHGHSRIPVRIFLVFVIVFCLAGMPVSARYAAPEGANAGINPGDRIFLTEESLNFTLFKNATSLLNPDYIAWLDGSSPVDSQSIDPNTARLRNPVTIEDSRSLARLFLPHYSDSTWGTSWVEIKQASVGSLKIRPVNTDVTPPAGDPPLTTIPYDMDVQFQLESTNLNTGNFSSGWYEYILTPQDQSETHQVINMNGATVSLKNLMEDPTADNNTLAFNIKDQGITNTAGTFTMRFRTQQADTNKLDLSTSLAFTVRTQGLAANFSPPNTTMGNTVTLRIYGKPYTYYTIVVPDSDDGRPQFPSGTYDIYTSQYNVTVHPDATGVVQVPMYVPVIAGDTSGTYRYYFPRVYATRTPSQSVTAQLAVGEPPGGLTTTSVVPVKPDLDADEFFSIGDTITINVKVGKDVDTAYFYITGPNLCANGAKPSEPWVCVIDGDAGTFDSLPVSSDIENYYKWDTMGTSLEPATYRLFAGRNTTGYLKRTLAAGNANDYIDIDLTNPSINAKFPEEAPGFFAKGDYVVSLWTARGSPFKEGTDGKYGTIRWYILGTNYRYTGYTTFPLLKVDGSGVSEEEMETLIKGGHDFPGYSGINFARNFSYGLMEGDYYLVYQHPMFNNVFDIYPEQGAGYTGTFRKLYSTSGNKQLDISTMDTSDALSAMLGLLRDPDIDDSLLSDHFFIQKPLVILDPVLNYEVGDEILMEGSTNLEESYDYPYNQINHPADKITLSLYTSDMYAAGKTQSTYKVYSTEGSLSSLAMGATRRQVSFSIPAQTTAQMMPGEYVAVISCEDIKYTTEITFVLHEQGYRKKNGITVKSEIGTDFSAAQGTIRPTSAVTPVKTATRSPTISRTATIPPTTKSPGMNGVDAASALLIISAILVSARRSGHER
ncbi:MAG: hypothetical protein M0R30_13575 [Methanoregula sp.]|jgi:hypothetical protein|uniref:hypothetical protein n=1 Tax=Methanoregula sp. TaxID=2052170 RepID=UPI0025D179B4|nr:hypothetical protein [Methanoregula sp.]MCK9632656.1 hypothetical protein [Methanoregula sp.]